METLLSSHRSFPYNPDIANTFFHSGEIEAWGRDIERIIIACKNDGFSTPEFRYDASGIWTIFKFEYPERKTTQKTTQNLTEQQQAMLSFLKEHPEATRKEISESLPNITEDGVKYNLSRLQELGLLERIGGRKQGYWKTIE
ncbi:helix-turn-helix domain-containing protein [Xylanibacter muris]|uniref:helix-turn-helix domain-containing protein n=1 Tax=Xylanibacter muris TaxID=2736290 RepID=UPI00255838F3|nr:helix-turn-helix domain-containing protein [Xylanibacter muris]